MMRWLGVWLVVALCVGGIFAWRDVRLQNVLNEARACRDIEELKGRLGEPFQVSRQYPFSLGAKVIGEHEWKREDMAIYAFVVQKVPMLFLVVKVNAGTGKIEAVALDNA